MTNPRRKIARLCGILLILTIAPIDYVQIFPNFTYITPTSSIHLPIEFNATQAYEDVRTQLEFGYRIPGTVEHNVCANWIREELEPVTD